VSPSAPIIELPDIVQSLQNKRWTGTLEILASQPDRITCLFFEDGVIQHCAPDRNPLVLGQALYALGLIDEADYVMTMVDYEQTGRPAGEVLVELGLVDKDAIHQALTYQGREHVLDVFGWERIDVKFHAGKETLPVRFSAQQRETRLALSGMSILMEAARRSDEWGIVRSSIPAESDVIMLAGDPLPADLIDRRIGLLIDSYRSAQEVARAAPADTLETLNQLADLVKNGHLKLLEPPELVKVGLVAEQDKDHPKALAVYQLAQDRGLDQLDLQRRIARVTSLLGRGEEALGLWLAVAERCTESNRIDLAVGALQEAFTLDTQNLELGLRLGRLLIDAKQQEEAISHLRGLVDLAEETASPERATEVLGFYLEQAPEDTEILERQSDLWLGLDNQLEAMVCLDDMATVLVDRGHLDQAVKIYYRVLDIDAENLQARLLLAQCLANKGSTDDAVREYRRLADILYRSGVIGNSINWPFLIRVYESIIELEPSATEAWEWLAKAYIENDQVDLAISRYIGMADSLEPKHGERPPAEILQPLRRIVEIAPRELSYRQRLANTHLALSQRDRAVACFRDLAEAALADGNVVDGRSGYNQALEQDPFDQASRRGLAEIHEQHGEREEAFKIWMCAGGMCYRAGLYDQAVQDYQRAYKIRDTDPDLLRELAEIEELRNRPPGAAMFWARFAHAMIESQNFGKAREALERAGRLDPNLPQVAQLMARL
jgi:tetratricopeptide (TPR) repeat protein